MNTTQEVTQEVTVETIEAMISVNEGVKFLEKYAPYDWRERLARAIFTNALYFFDSKHDVLGICFRATVYIKSLPYGLRAHALEKDDYKYYQIFWNSTDVKNFFGAHMRDETRTPFNWHNLGFEVKSSDIKKRNTLTWAWRQRLEHELQELEREKRGHSQ